MDFEVLDWKKYISEEVLLKSIPTVYGCDPRDEETFRELLASDKVDETVRNSSSLEGETVNGEIIK